MRHCRRLGQACRTCYCRLQSLCRRPRESAICAACNSPFSCSCAPSRAGAAARISRPADPSHRAAGRRQRHRHGRAHSRRRARPTQIGQQIIVDDRPGGALTVGLDLTAKAAPDGYTLCMGPIGALAITRHLVANLPYDIERDFQPIVRGGARPPAARGVADDTVPVGHGADRLRQGRIRESSPTRRRATARPAMSAASCSSS